jgi:hypothetical protein
MSIVDSITAVVPLTAYQKKVNDLYNNLYWPIMQQFVPKPGENVIGRRYKNKADCVKEAREMAKFHAGMLSRFGYYKIVYSLENDPWQRYSGNQVDVTQMRRAAGYFVIDTRDDSVYDHRIRYCIPEPWAYTLGFVNPLFLWSRIGAPLENPYKDYKNAAAAAYYTAKGVLKSRAGYVE